MSACWRRWLSPGLMPQEPRGGVYPTSRGSPPVLVAARLPITLGGFPGLAAAALGVTGVAIHSRAWSEFFSNLTAMEENVQVSKVGVRSNGAGCCRATSK